MELASRDLGIACVPRFALRGAIEAGRLVPLLEDHGAEAIALGAVYLEGRALPRKVRALMDFAAEDIAASSLLQA